MPMDQTSPDELEMEHCSINETLRIAVRKLGIVAVQEALEEAARIPDVLAMDFSEIFRKENWGIGRNPLLQNVTFSTQLKGQLSGVSSTFDLITAAYQADAIVAILKHLTGLALDIQKQYKRFVEPMLADLSKGIASITSLPDEIIGHILECSVQAAGHGGGEQAKGFSLVSRRFRKIALEQRNMWTSLPPNALKRELELFAFRSGANTDLHAFVDFASVHHYHPWRDLVDFARATAPRWRTLTIGYFAQTDKRRGVFESENIEKVLASLRDDDNIKFSRLEELEIQGGETKSSFYVLRWAAPNLHAVRCSRFIPSPSATFSAVTSFTYSHQLTKGELTTRLLALLTSMPALSHLTLNLRLLKEADQPLQLAESLCPSVTSLDLQIQSPAYFSFGPSRGVKNPLFAGAFLQALRTPKLEFLNISVEFSTLIWKDDDEINALMGELSRSLLPEQFTAPSARLSSLKYRLATITGTFNLPRPRNEPIGMTLPWTFKIPLDRIPTVSSLTLTSCAQIVFIRENECEEGVSTGTARPCGQPREIRFRGCAEMRAEDLQSTVQSLKNINRWGCIERFVVEDCSCLKYDDAVKVIGKEKICYSA